MMVGDWVTFERGSVLTGKVVRIRRATAFVQVPALFNEGDARTYVEKVANLKTTGEPRHDDE